MIEQGRHKQLPIENRLCPLCKLDVEDEYQWRIQGGFRGFKPPPPLGCQKKIIIIMCIEKRHHNMSRPTQYVPIALCLRLSLRQ